MLKEIVLEELREPLRFVSRHEKRFVLLVMGKSAQDHKRESSSKKKAISKHRHRIAEIDTLIERLYVDNSNGKVTDERYEKMSAKFEEEQAALIRAHDALEAEIAENEEQASGVDRFLDTVHRYTEIKNLIPVIVHEFIDRIIIYEPEQARGNHRQAGRASSR